MLIRGQRGGVGYGYDAEGVDLELGRLWMRQWMRRGRGVGKREGKKGGSFDCADRYEHVSFLLECWVSLFMVVIFTFLLVE